jgi:universal stress protein E
MEQLFQHLLVIQQHSSDDGLALSRAIALALQYHSKVTVFKSCYKQLQLRQHDNDAANENLAVWVQQQQQAIFEQVTSMTTAPVELDIIISWRDSEKYALNRLTRQGDFSLVIAQQHKPRGLGAVLAIGLQHYLISDCDLPVWLVKQSTAEQEMTILACLNLDSEHNINNTMNQAIVNIGSQLCENHLEQLHIINCYCGDNYAMSLPYSDDTGFAPLDDVAQQHNVKLQGYLSQLKLPKQCIHLNEGLPDDEIPKTVQQTRSKLAIIGNNHTHDMRSILLGDTAHYLTEHMPCDVLIIKPQQAQQMVAAAR